MTRTTHWTGLLVMVVLVSAVSAGTVAALATVDDDHSLYENETKSEYEKTGYVTARGVGGLLLDLTVSKTEDGCGVSEWEYSDLSNDFVCLDYNEDISRTIRIYIPRGYVGINSGEIESVNGNATAEFEETASGDLMMTVHLDGKTQAAWALSQSEASFRSVRSTAQTGVKNLSGVSVFEAGSQWQYINQSEFGSAGGVYALKIPNDSSADEILVEYQVGNDSWATPGESSTTRKPVYVTTRDGVDDRVYVYSAVDKPPTVRYKTDPDSRDVLSSAFRELSRLDDRIKEAINRLPL